jgi:outer membrane immunogenic protein
LDFLHINSPGNFQHSITSANCFGALHIWQSSCPITEQLQSADCVFRERTVLPIMLRKVILLVIAASLLTAGAMAQEQRSEISLQGTGFYTKDSNGQGIRQQGTDTGGFLIGYRYHLKRWLAAETTYGFVRNTQTFSAPLAFAGIQTDVHQATGGLVFRLPSPARFRLSPYVLAEGGALVFNPTSNTLVPGADSQARGAFIYGGGADFLLSKHFSLRAEYRGFVYKAPDFGLAALNTDAVTHSAQPSAGIVFRF